MGINMMKVMRGMFTYYDGKSVKSFVQMTIGSLLLFLMQTTLVAAQELSLRSIDFSALPGDQLQLQLGMSGPAFAPKVFQTENPARIALDFPGVTSDLPVKTYPVNIGVTSSVHAVEASGRVRVVINLIEMVPYETRVEGNNVFVKLKSGKPVIAPPPKSVPVARTRRAYAELPKQTISNIDFRRGNQGEGRIVVSLTDPNTVVDFREEGGKLLVHFTNTTLPPALSRRLDVSDFATPVESIDTMAEGTKTKMVVTPKTGDYDYSSYQTDGMLTIEFRALTQEEKEEALKKKFPYTGERLSLNFQDIEVRSVLQILADFTNLNIVASDSVSGNVTLRLNDVPWDQALDLILKSKGLSKREAGNVVLVAPTAEINKIEREELEAQKVVQKLEPLRTEFIQVNFAKAENFRNLLLGGFTTGSIDGCSVTGSGSRGSGGGGAGAGGRAGIGGGAAAAQAGSSVSRRADDKYTLLSDRGTAIVDSRTNILIVRDTVKQLEEIRKLLLELDKPVRQVMIESRVVIASNDFAKELGVRFNASTFSESDSIITGETLPSGPLKVGNDTISGVSGLVDLATVAAPHGTLAVTLLKAGDYLLDLELTALQDEARGEIISNPRVMTSDRCEATIIQGVQIPYTVQADIGATPTTQLIDANLEMHVTPQITPNGNVIMDLQIHKDAQGDPVNVATGNTAPAIDTRVIRTSVQVENGDTVVLGGVYESEYGRSVNKVPFFADLPGIGFLFKRTRVDDNKRELLFFVTPKVIKSSVRAR
ncbi:MAG: type IV pilus secretin PilQ [Pseudomonadota bacterium]